LIHHRYLRQVKLPSEWGDFQKQHTGKNSRPRYKWCWNLRINLNWHGLQVTVPEDESSTVPVKNNFAEQFDREPFVGGIKSPKKMKNG
jgi:hypothetical protein